MGWTILGIRPNPALRLTNLMKMFICPIDWVHWRELFEPESMVSLVDSPEDLDQARPPWIKDHYEDFFRDIERDEDPGAPSRLQIEHLILWLRPRINDQARLLIHCHAGRGRSPAAGYIAWAMLFGPGREHEAFECMIASCIQTAITPNRLVIAHADEILGRKGSLVRPLQAWNRKVSWSRTFR
jgi:predicted protein tyrosine phosphatase